MWKKIKNWFMDGYERGVDLILGKSPLSPEDPRM